MIGGIDFWKKLSKYFPKPVSHKKKGLAFSYLYTEEGMRFALKSYVEAAPNTLFVIRFEPDLIRKDCLVVLFTRRRQDANRYGIWFDCKDKDIQEMGFFLFKGAQTVFVSMENTEGTVLFQQALKEKENYFPVDFTKGPFLLKVMEDDQAPVFIPISFKPFLKF